MYSSFYPDLENAALLIAAQKIADSYGINIYRPTQEEFLYCLTMDIYLIYQKLYQECASTNLSNNFDFRTLSEPRDPEATRIGDSIYLERCLKKYLHHIIELYKLILEEISKGYIYEGISEGELVDLIDIPTPEAVTFSEIISRVARALEAIYFQNVDSMFNIVSYEEYAPGTSYTPECTDMVDSDIRDGLHVITRLALVARQYHPAPIVIAYRDSARGEGALFDHRTFQQITGQATLLSIPKNTTPEVFMAAVGLSQMNLTTNPSTITRGDFYIPEIATREEEKSGLLVITGRGALSKNPERRRVQVLRNNHERPLIRAAFNRRQPYLGICGGMWQTHLALHGLGPEIDEGAETGLIASPHHRGRMPSLVNGSVTHNTLEHSLHIPANTTLRSLMNLKNLAPPLCNSVHWLAINAMALSPLVRIAATASPLRDSATTIPEAELGIVEAFEAAHGAPQIAVQWHPEAFARTHSLTVEDEVQARPHQDLIRGLAREATIFHRRYAMLEELGLRRRGAIYRANPLAAERIDQILTWAREDMVDL